VVELEDLREDELIKDWLSEIEAAPSTRRNYIQSMKFYTNFAGKTPEQLIEEAEEEVKSGILMRKRKIKRYLLEFREYLKEERKVAPKTLHNHMVAVKSFYRSFDIDLPNLNRKKDFGNRELEENNKRLSKDDIREMLKFTDVRSKALILLMSSSGLAENEVMNLRYGSFKEGLDESTGITTLKLRRIKTRVDFITFTSPETTKAIMDYIDYRNRKPKQDDKKSIQTWEKHRINTEEDYLFIKKDVPDDYLRDHDETKRKMRRGAFIQIFRQIAKKMGNETGFGVWQVVRPHNLRKFFNTQLLNGGADIFFVDFLMGHQIDQTRRAYFKADEKKLKERYMKYLPYLPIEKTETRILESEEYKDLKGVLDEKEERIRILESEIYKMKEVEEEKKAVEGAREPFDAIMSMIMKNPKIQEAIKEAIVEDENIARKIKEMGLSK
jgi:integrase